MTSKQNMTLCNSSFEQRHPKHTHIVLNMLQSNKLARNFLLQTHEQMVTTNLFKIAFQIAKRGHRVLFIAAKPLEKLPVDENDPLAAYLLDGNIIRNIIFKYTNQADGFMNILLEINVSRVKPRLIIVDWLHTFFSDVITIPSANIKQDLYDDFIRKHMLIVALVQHSVNNVVKFMGKECFSVVCIDVVSNKIYETFVQSIVDQYFVEKNVIFDSSLDLLKLFETIVVQ